MSPPKFWEICIAAGTVMTQHKQQTNVMGFAVAASGGDEVYLVGCSNCSIDVSVLRAGMASCHYRFCGEGKMLISWRGRHKSGSAPFRSRDAKVTTNVGTRSQAHRLMFHEFVGPPPQGREPQQAAILGVRFWECVSPRTQPPSG